MASNAMPIKWHKECAKNSRGSLIEKIKKLQNLQSDISRHHKELLFYDLQIERAILAGKKSFDASKFMVKKEKKNG
jgi:hypothetical protein